MSQSSSNVFLFFGEDDFSLQKKITHWKAEFAKKYSGNSITLIDVQELSEQELSKKLEEVFTPSLFSSKKLIVAKDILPSKAAQEQFGLKLIAFIERLPQEYFLIFWQTKKPDKRLKIVKKILSVPINLLEFNLPAGSKLNAEIKKQAQDLNVKIDDEAVEKLAVFLGRDLFEEKRVGGRVVERKEAFNLWEVYSELFKLASFTGHIKTSDVEKLVKPKVSENVFVLSGEIAKKNKQAALRTLENLMEAQVGDEKSAIIKILGLLAEQTRSLILVGSLAQEKLTQTEIAQKLGWSSGRVSITLKHAQKSDLSQLKNLFTQLLNIDEKLKTQDVNPKLLVDLFITAAAS
ncbi:MAG: hypothetical protein HYW51_03650 [Candidatus Doudnabacteria bacterium]|nr:hypothetical protein [Candidatus Doudnabacteria bacterium]